MIPLAVAVLLAHHSFTAEFDVNKRVTLSGRVTRIEWLNPHAHVYIDVKNERGEATAWSIELGSPNTLRQRGWTTTLLKVGDVITIDGSLAKDGRNLANARSVVFANGVRMFTGPRQGETS